MLYKNITKEKLTFRTTINGKKEEVTLKPGEDIEVDGIQKLGNKLELVGKGTKKKTKGEK